MSTKKKFLSSVAFATVILALELAPNPSVAGTVVVTPNSMGDWAFANSDGNGTVGANSTGTGAMVVGPGSPPLGTGSANLATGNGTSGGDGAEILSNSGFAGVALSSLTALGFSTYDTQNNGQQFPYLSIEVTYGAGLFDQLFFEPPYQTPSTGNPSLPNQGATALNTWQSWNAQTGGFWDNNGLCGSPGSGVGSLASCISALKDPTIINSFGTAGVLDGVGGIQLAVGFAGPSDQFNGYVDAFTIGVNGADTTFDFEPLTATPLPAALPLFAGGLGLIGFLGGRRKRRTKPVAA